MIKPTIGRVVLFWIGPEQSHPFAATIAFVHSDRMVNLSYVDHVGEQHAATSVTLVQPEDMNRPTQHYCEWMPYQVGQAAKTEALEKKLEETGKQA